MANFTGLAAARHALLARADWDVEAQGLFGAPEINVVVGAEAHGSIFAALQMLGLGRDRVTRIEADDQGRMPPGFLSKLAGIPSAGACGDVPLPEGLPRDVHETAPDGVPVSNSVSLADFT